MSLQFTLIADTKCRLGEGPVYDERRHRLHPVPVAVLTMPRFGGADFRTLYPTSLREGRAEEALSKAQWTGSPIAAPAPVAGFPSWRFLDI